MAVAKRCDRCKKYYELTPDSQFVYEENGKNFTVNSFRIGNWNPKTKAWESIVSAYDLCKDCAKEITQTIFNVGELETRVPVKKDFRKKTTQNEDDSDESFTAGSLAN